MTEKRENKFSLDAVVVTYNHNDELSHAVMMAAKIAHREAEEGGWMYSPSDFFHGNPCWIEFRVDKCRLVMYVDIAERKMIERLPVDCVSLDEHYLGAIGEALYHDADVELRPLKDLEV